MRKLKKIQQGSFLICGDFNTVPDLNMDSMSTPTKRSLSLSPFLRNHKLYDVWRCTHANEKDYSFYSHRHCVYIRIDLFLADKWLLQKITQTKVNNITWSDHASVLFEIRDAYPNNNAYIWRSNSQVI